MISKAYVKVWPFNLGSNFFFFFTHFCLFYAIIIYIGRNIKMKTIKYYDNIWDCLDLISDTTQEIANQENYIFNKSRVSASMYLQYEDGGRELRISNHRLPLDIDLRKYYNEESAYAENLTEAENAEWEKHSDWDCQQQKWTRFSITESDEKKYINDLVKLLQENKKAE